jgi:hypothetical protein
VKPDAAPLTPKLVTIISPADHAYAAAVLHEPWIKMLCVILDPPLHTRKAAQSEDHYVKWQGHWIIDSRKPSMDNGAQ